MLVPLSWTMSLLFSPFGERAWVGPGIWVSKMLNRYSVLALWSGGEGKRDTRNDAKSYESGAPPKLPASVCLFLTNLCPDDDGVATRTTWPMGLVAMSAHHSVLITSYNIEVSKLIYCLCWWLAKQGASWNIVKKWSSVKASNNISRQPS